MRATWIILGVAVATGPLGGCAMHGGMGGMHGGAAGHSGAPPGAVEAEAETPALRVSLLVPEAMVGQAVTMTVRVRSATLGDPVSGAEVVVMVRQADAPDGTALRAEETTQRGVYQASHRFASTGPYEVAAEVRADDDPAQRVVVTVRTVVARGERHGTGVPTAAAVAGLAMIVMMGGMVASGTGF